MSTPSAPMLHTLIARAESDLFTAAVPEQRHSLAEAWANFRQGALLLATLDEGRLHPQNLLEALERAQAAVHALRFLTLAQGAHSEA